MVRWEERKPQEEEVVVITEQICSKMNIDLKKVSIAIQGFGNVGGAAARLLYKKGYKVVAISDVNTALYKKDGVDVLKATEYMQEYGTILGYEEEDMQRITNKELLTLDIDVFIPAGNGESDNGCAGI